MYIVTCSSLHICSTPAVTAVHLETQNSADESSWSSLPEQGNPKTPKPHEADLVKEFDLVLIN